MTYQEEEKKQSLNEEEILNFSNLELTKFDYNEFFNKFKKSMINYNPKIISLYQDEHFQFFYKNELFLSRSQQKYITKLIKKLNQFSKK